VTSGGGHISGGGKKGGGERAAASYIIIVNHQSFIIIIIVFIIMIMIMIPHHCVLHHTHTLQPLVEWQVSLHSLAVFADTPCLQTVQPHILEFPFLGFRVSVTRDDVTQSA
jgi:hypothetical protein